MCRSIGTVGQGVFLKFVEKAIDTTDIDNSFKKILISGGFPPGFDKPSGFDTFWISWISREDQLMEVLQLPEEDRVFDQIFGRRKEKLLFKHPWFLSTVRP